MCRYRGRETSVTRDVSQFKSLSVSSVTVAPICLLFITRPQVLTSVGFIQTYSTGTLHVWLFSVQAGRSDFLFVLLFLDIFVSRHALNDGSRYFIEENYFFISCFPCRYIYVINVLVPCFKHQHIKCLLSTYISGNVTCRGRRYHKKYFYGHMNSF